MLKEQKTLFFRFVPQGWIKAYDWSEADLEAACELVVKESKSNDDRGEWESGRELLDVSIYGGRLQDNYDLRALKAILRVIWSKEVYKGNRKLGEVIDLQHLNSENVLQVIDRLDSVDLLQEYFGLPANANRSWEKSAVEAELALLKGSFGSFLIEFFSLFFLSFSLLTIDMFFSFRDHNQIVETICEWSTETRTEHRYENTKRSEKFDDPTDQGYQNFNKK